MRLSLSTGSLYVYPLRWAFHAARDAGYDGVELVLGPEAVLRGALGVQQLARACGMPVFSVHPPILPLPGWDGVESIPRAVDFAVEVGAPLVVMHTPDAESLDGLEGRVWLRALEAGRRHGEERGVAVALENRAIFHDRQRRCALAHPEALRRFADVNDLPLTLDVVHAATWPYDVLDAYALFRGRLANIHLSDLRPVPGWLDRPKLHSYFKHHQLPGTGVLPIGELVEQILRDGYEGAITLELSPVALGAWRPAQAQERLTQTVQFLRNLARLEEVHIPGM